MSFKKPKVYRGLGGKRSFSVIVVGSIDRKAIMPAMTELPAKIMFFTVDIDVTGSGYGKRPAAKVFTWLKRTCESLRYTPSPTIVWNSSVRSG